MSAYHGMTATQLADELDRATRMTAEHAVTGPVSMLDEATFSYLTTMPGTPVAAAQQAFAEARYAHMRSYTTERGDYDPSTWAHLQAAARTLATELRMLGEHRIARCTEPAGWGTCNLPLGADGTCDGRCHTAEAA